MPFGKVNSFQRVFSLFSYHLLDGIKILSTCRGILIEAIIEKYGHDIIEFCGIDCDKWLLLLFLILRDIARYAKEHNTLVLTGVIFVYSISLESSSLTMSSPTKWISPS